MKRQTEKAGVAFVREGDFESFCALCAQKGVRMTEARRIVARVLAESDDHPDVEKIYDRAKAFDKKISLATVYRTVRLFADSGIVARHDFLAGRSRYETAEVGHDHIVDEKTGKIVEFSDARLHRLMDAVARELGYIVSRHKLILYCQPRRSTDV